MAIFVRCDLCGKHTGMSGITFSNSPVVSIVEGINGKRFRVVMNIELEDENDFEAYKNIIENSEKIIPDAIIPHPDMPGVAIAVKKMPLSSAIPTICDQCKLWTIKAPSTEAFLERFQSRIIKEQPDERLVEYEFNEQQNRNVENGLLRILDAIANSEEKSKKDLKKPQKDNPQNKNKSSKRKDDDNDTCDLSTEK